MATDELGILKALELGEISIQGEFLWGSNYTFAVEVNHNGQELQGVYKPTQGERPLWDFPRESLARREVAAFLVSEAIGWEFVPPTVYRQDGPIGPGSLQLFIDHDPEYNYFTFTKEDLQRLRPVVLFDILINNADRKGSHIILDDSGKIWLIDHGICFHIDEKLRTVIWDYAGEEIPAQLLADVKRLRDILLPLNKQPPEFESSDLVRELGKYLNKQEIAAIIRRADRLLENGCYPNPDLSRRQYPWPPV